MFKATTSKGDVSKEDIDRIAAVLDQMRDEIGDILRMMRTLTLKLDSREHAGAEIEEFVYEAAFELVRKERKVSTSLLQRHLKIGYGKAAVLVDMLEERGVIGPQQGSKPREILLDEDE